VNQLSAEEQQKKQGPANPRVIELLREANGAVTDEAKREFMRACHHTLCTQMRKLVRARLDGSVSDYEHVHPN